jgi:hypothetical protein
MHTHKRHPHSFPCVLAALVCSVALVLPAAASAAPARPLRTAVVDADAFYDLASIPTASQLVRSTGAQAVRLYVDWREIAPWERPAGFEPTNPRDPAYFWERLDRQVTYVVQNGMSPILSILRAPPWASQTGEGPEGSRRPDAQAYGKFILAVARRYSGSFEDLPRVRYWQAWNEPNYFRHLGPQYDTPLSEEATADSKLLSPGIYRGLVNAFAKSVHSVHEDNLVVAGGLSPFGKEFANMHVARNLPFMRKLFCLNDQDRPIEGCKKKVRFDVWSHHPYTAGGPSHKNITPLDVSLGDLPRMRRVLMAAVRAGRVISSHRRIDFWGTEFSWDTDPPDPNAVPMELHTRWVAHALYQMWKSGMSLVTWFQIQDHPGQTADGHSFESGLYFDCEENVFCAAPKPSMYAFRFPFVAFTQKRGVLVWGRTPDSEGGPVRVEQRVNDEWRKVASLTADRYGIFTETVRAKRRGFMRAQIVRAGERTISVPFSLKREPDRAVNPFG